MSGSMPTEPGEIVAMGLVDAEIVDEPAVGEAGRDLEAFLLVEPALHQLVAGDPHAEDEIGTDPLADRRHDLEAEAHPVLQAPAVPVLPLVGDRRQEAVDQMMGGRDHFAAVEPALLAALARIGEGLQDPAEVPVLHLLGIGAMERLARGRGRDQRQPVPAVPGAAPAHMGDLAEDRRAVPVDPLGEGMQIGKDPVVADVDLVEGQRRVRRDRRRAAEHGQRQAALGLFLVIELVALSRHAVLGEAGRMGRAHDPVAELQMLQPKGCSSASWSRIGLSLKLTRVVRKRIKGPAAGSVKRFPRLPDDRPTACPV